MIPKVVHYFWFGPAAKPALAERCIASWRSALPDFEIKEWTEANYDVAKTPFSREAHAKGQWAFLADYARLDVLHNHGGVYLDVDVEMFKDITPLLSAEMFLGFMYDCILGTAVIGAVPGQPIIAELLAQYDQMSFDGCSNNNVFTDFFIKRFPQFRLNNQQQQLEGVSVYPKEYFEHPVLWGAGGYSVHQFMGSWWRRDDSSERFKTLVKESLGRPGYWALRQLTHWRAVRESPYLERHMADSRR